jgi:hypothetical protein
MLFPGRGCVETFQLDKMETDEDERREKGTNLPCANSGEKNQDCFLLEIKCAVAHCAKWMSKKMAKLMEMSVNGDDHDCGCKIDKRLCKVDQLQRR